MGLLVDLDLGFSGCFWRRTAFLRSYAAMSKDPLQMEPSHATIMAGPTGRRRESGLATLTSQIPQGVN
jgi:hypothetical protein